MEFIFQIGKRCFSISIGYKTKWFEQTPLIMIMEVFFNAQRTVDWARVIYQSPHFLDAKPETKLTFEEAQKKAIRNINRIVNSSKKWPEEEWVSISNDWELNIFTTCDQPRANLHPVINGEIDMSVIYPVFSID